ncbi:hypothetical protein O181_099184 [Austropuccinia psidii MF-1]|uniref:Uncharacterized protein n=1 Tax=Austropuccinia psidii MF-1 TaxID=1389203 RepID=A0A9Q3JC71_9BASI|nr:hypothetical protein [Austropuccinia psidii MF-1]
MWEANTGVGLSEEEMGMTIQQKLETMCPCYERMDQIFVSKPNVMELNELNMTSQDPINIGSASEEGSHLEAFSDGESGISAYEQLQWHLNRTKKRKDTESNDQITVNKGPKGNQAASKRALITQGAMGNLKKIHEQEDQENEDMRVRLLKDFVYLQANKWSDEKFIIKEKNDCNYQLKKERMERQFKLGTKEKERKKNESDCNYELEKEHMEHQFDLEREQMNCETSLMETKLAMAKELLLSGKTSEEITGLLKQL